MEELIGFDAAADDVVVLIRHEDGWRILRDDQAAAPELPDAGLPQRHRWSEVDWAATVQGWQETRSEGEFVLTDEQREIINATYGRLVAEGKLTTWTNAGDRR